MINASIKKKAHAGFGSYPDQVDATVFRRVSKYVLCSVTVY